MKPTNKFQRNLIEVDSTLPEITQTQKDLAEKNCLMHKAVRLLSGKTTCLDCGHSWKYEGNVSVCPECHTELIFEITRQKVFRDNDYCTILTTHLGFQVIRQFEVFGYYKSGQKSDTDVREISRIYIDEKGKFGIIGYSFSNTWYGDRWFGTFDLKHNSTIRNHSFSSKYVYPKKKIIPEIKRNGFKGDTHTLTHFNIFYAILSNPISETLLKTKQNSLFIQSASYYGAEKVEKYWNALKICIRNNYIVKNAKDYLDYLELLEYFGRDLQNSKFVCPENLNKAHNKYVEKKRKASLKIKLEQLKAQIIEDQEEYEFEKKKYFGLSFTDGIVIVNVIEKVEEVMKLGDYFSHCIYENEYHKEKNSLLLCASVDDIPVETVEFDLNSQKVVQSRGFKNHSSAYNKKIISLVNSHKKEIKRRAVMRKVSA